MASLPGSTVLKERQRHDRIFYFVSWLAILTIVFLGFARSYYLRTFFESSALPALLHVHGLLMTSWIVLFIVQSRLIAAHRYQWHRRLGGFGVGLACAILIVGFFASVKGARLGHVPDGVSPSAFLLADVVAFAVFAGLVGAAIWFRRRGDFHKRLMLLATLSLVGAAVARMPDWLPVPVFGVPGGRWFSLDMLLTYACVAWDSIRHRRLHPAFGWGLAWFALGENYLSTLPADTKIWHWAAAHLMG